MILHDSSCIYQFNEHDIVIPISVIEELDRFKKGKETLNCNAREFLRALDGIINDQIFNGGIVIAPGKGKISIKLKNAFHDKVASNIWTASQNGLSYLIAKMKGQKLSSHINLEKGERSELSELAMNLL